MGLKGWVLALTLPASHGPPGLGSLGMTTLQRQPLQCQRRVTRCAPPPGLCPVTPAFLELVPLAQWRAALATGLCLPSLSFSPTPITLDQLQISSGPVGLPGAGSIHPTRGPSCFFTVVLRPGPTWAE